MHCRVVAGVTQPGDQAPKAKPVQHVADAKFSQHDVEDILSIECPLQSTWFVALNVRDEALSSHPWLQDFDDFGDELPTDHVGSLTSSITVGWSAPR